MVVRVWCCLGGVVLRGLKGVDPTITKREAGQTWEAVAIGAVEKKLPRRARGFFLNKRHVGWKQAMEAFARAGSAGSGEEETERMRVGFRAARATNDT